MKNLTQPVCTHPALEKARKRLLREYRKFRSWRKLAVDLSTKAGFQINHYYPLEFARKGIVPANKHIQRALGIPRLPRPVTINQLLQLPIQDMPTEILRLAYENRQEMTS